MKGLSTFSVWPGRAFRPGWVINGAALDLNFARGRYWSAGTGATGDLTKLAGYSFNRTGVAWAQEEIGGSGSDIIEYAENVAQTPIGRGYVAEESRTSLAPDSDDLTQWTENGSITVADAGDDIGAGVSWATLTYGYTGTGGLPNSTRKNAISFATATQYVFSIYARAGTTDKFSLRAYCAGTTTVDGVATFTLGTETATAQSDADSAGIEALGGGLYRCWVVFTTDASTTGVNLRIGGPNSLSVTTGETIDMALPVLEAGGFPTEPICTKDAITSVTRGLGDLFLDLDPVDNLLSNSAFAGAVVGNVLGGDLAGSMPTGWSLSSASTITDVDVLSIQDNGDHSVVEVSVSIDNQTGGSQFPALVFGSHSTGLATGQEYTDAALIEVVSFTGSLDAFRFQIQEVTGAGTNVGTSTENVPQTATAETRYTASRTLTDPAPTSVRCRVSVRALDGESATFVIKVRLPVINEGLTDRSSDAPITTVASGARRWWVNVPLPGGGYLEPSKGFSIYYDGPARIDTGAARVLFELCAANSDRMALELTGFNLVRFNFREGASHNRSTGESISGDPTGPLKLALSYDGSTTARMSVNGSAAHGGSGFTFVDATKLQIGSQVSHASVSNADHGRLVLFQGVLTDAQLEALSS